MLRVQHKAWGKGVGSAFWHFNKLIIWSLISRYFVLQHTTRSNLADFGQRRTEQQSIGRHCYVQFKSLLFPAVIFPSILSLETFAHRVTRRREGGTSQESGPLQLIIQCKYIVINISHVSLLAHLHYYLVILTLQHL